jgi:hypothetical protein
MRASLRSPFTLAAAAGVVAIATVACGAGADAGQAARQTTSPTSTTAAGPAVGPWHVTATSPVDTSTEFTAADSRGAVVSLDRGSKSSVVITAGTILKLPVPKGYLSGGEYFAGSPVAPPALDAQGKGVYLIQSPSSSDYDAALNLDWMATGEGGAHRLSSGAVFPQFASDASGNAIAVWAEFKGYHGNTSPYDLRVSIRRADHGFSKPITLGAAGDPYLGNNGPHGDSVTAAIGGGGRIAVVGMGSGPGIRAWTGTVAKGLAKTPIRIGGPKAFGEAFTATIGAKGRTFVAWGQQASGEDPDNPWVVKASSIAPGARKAAAVQTVDAGEVAFPVAFPKLVADSAGRALLGWSAVAKGDQGPYPVRTVSISPSGAFATPETLAQSGALTGLAVAPTGSAIATWQSLSDTEEPSSYLASVRPTADGTFAAAEGVPIPFVGDAPQPAFDFEGRPVLAYTVPNTSGTRGVTVSLLTRDKP